MVFFLLPVCPSLVAGEDYNPEISMGMNKVTIEAYFFTINALVQHSLREETMSHLYLVEKVKRFRWRTSTSTLGWR